MIIISREEKKSYKTVEWIGTIYLLMPGFEGTMLS